MTFRLALCAVLVGVVSGDSTDCQITPQLEFCTRVNYTTYATDVANGDHRAKEYYLKVVNTLRRYNCEERYSLWGCDDCLEAYRRWACALELPKCGSQDEPLPYCRHVCYNVVQKCPVELGFNCPVADPDTPEGECDNAGVPKLSPAGQL